MRYEDEIFAAVAATVAASGTAVVLGGALALASGEFVLSDMFGILTAWFVVWIIACLHLIVAMPLYLLCRKLGWVNWVTAGLAGAAVGVLPTALLVRMPLDDGSGLYAWLGFAGLVGGITFRAVLGRDEGIL